MNSEPAGLDRAALIDTLRTAWGLEVDALAYVPVGFGTHHYRAGDWFVNVDEAAGKPGLAAALGVAVALRYAGLDVVHAPVPTRTGGSTVAWLDDGYAVSVYPFLHGTSFAFGDELPVPVRHRVLTALGRIHATTGIEARRDPVRVPLRDEFDAALDQLGTPWAGGPYAEPARALLRDRVATIRGLFDRYDELARTVRAGGEPWCVTHGEPHAGNVMRLPDGTIRLIDWDTAAIAPRERDLWLVEPSTDADWAAYVAGGGPERLDPSAIELYRLLWMLSDLTSFTAIFRSPHADDADTRVAWRSLRSSYS